MIYTKLLVLDYDQLFKHLVMPLTFAGTFRRFLQLIGCDIFSAGVYMMTVCWTIFDRVHCGRLNANGRNIISKVNVIEPGAVQDVCTGNGPCELFLYFYYVSFLHMQVLPGNR